jgi:hypothetical protein
MAGQTEALASHPSALSRLAAIPMSYLPPDLCSFVIPALAERVVYPTVAAEKAEYDGAIFGPEFD